MLAEGCPAWELRQKDHRPVGDVASPSVTSCTRGIMVQCRKLKGGN